jgi:phosphatidylglycerophosphate synthase
MASMVFAAVGAAAISLDVGVVGSIICILGIQLRLLCNLFDGMVAIEGGKLSDVGAIYNEFPDRVSDTLLLIALGYAAGAPLIGELTAGAALLTAYVRVFGGSLGLQQRFSGPLAKQERMAVMTLALGLNIVENLLWGSQYALWIGITAIGIGSLLTCVTRTLKMAEDLKALRQLHAADNRRGEVHVDQ